MTNNFLSCFSSTIVSDFYYLTWSTTRIVSITIFVYFGSQLPTPKRGWLVGDNKFKDLILPTGLLTKALISSADISVFDLHVRYLRVLICFVHIYI